MLTKKNKVCHTCSTEYKFCTGCAEYDHLPRWMALFHSDNCRKIFSIISSYNVNHITKEEAAERLRECDLSYKNTMKPSIIEKIDEILKEEVEDFVEPVEAKINTISDSIESIVENIELEYEDVNVLIDSIEYIEPIRPRYSRKKK